MVKPDKKKKTPKKKEEKKEEKKKTPKKRGGKKPTKGPFKGFFVLPVKGGSDRKASAHHLYYKKHQAASGTPAAPAAEDGWETEVVDTSDRTLFVVNVPWNWEFADLQQVFSCFGGVESVQVLKTAHNVALPPGTLTSRQPTESGGRRALVVFETAAELTAALTESAATSTQPYQEPSVKGGMQKWLADYERARPDVAGLQMQVDRFMEAFDMRTGTKKRGRGQEVDADGWTVVQSNSKQRRLLLPKEVAAEGPRKKKKEDKQLHFYKFQQRQEKKDQLADLRAKFEEDKAKLAKLKESRQFNPF